MTEQTKLFYDDFCLELDEIMENEKNYLIKKMTYFQRTSNPSCLEQ